MLARIAKLWAAAKGWRTLVVSLTLAIVGVLQTADWATIVGPGAVGPVMLGIGAVVAVLRTFTDTPIGTK
ncbi:MAG: hypothetical protein WDM94_06900 [Bauldia sp.]